MDQLDQAHVACGSGHRRGRRGIVEVRFGTVLVVVPAVVAKSHADSVAQPDASAPTPIPAAIRTVMSGQAKTPNSFPAGITDTQAPDVSVRGRQTNTRPKVMRPSARRNVALLLSTSNPIGTLIADSVPAPDFEENSVRTGDPSDDPPLPALVLRTLAHCVTHTARVPGRAAWSLRSGPAVSAGLLGRSSCLAGARAVGGRDEPGSSSRRGWAARCRLCRRSGP